MSGFHSLLCWELYWLFVFGNFQICLGFRVCCFVRGRGQRVESNYGSIDVVTDHRAFSGSAFLTQIAATVQAFTTLDIAALRGGTVAAIPSRDLSHVCVHSASAI